MDIRIGQGFDVHPFVEGKPLTLGGVSIPHTHGLVSHSDGDALLHAITDAVLGAMGGGDIGSLFPNTDAQWKNRPSIGFLTDVWELAKKERWQLVNCDATLMAERPKLLPHVPAMKEKIAAAFGAEVSQIAIKATTTEELGFVGRREGLVASAVVLLRRDP